MLQYTFSEAGLGQLLNQLSDSSLDELPFGVVKMDLTGKVLAYNKAESRITGVAPEQAIGKHFFSQIAPCTNNFMVASRYEQPSLDEELDYIFTYVTTPTRVRLRLMRTSDSSYQYLLAKSL
ncbi:PAS domain-containing protein [Spirosoma spitsbergense]|jgi:photoactive yellow protein|uniref:PAS domain-containing protein n=1 Tax=Spirosoma spitsbergense TaxID=431554 RepID=UPI0003666033|nr:PAS domain-containing protein [Spirosoma spitsbergense]